MAVPKKRTSPSRRGRRRAGQHHRLHSRGAISCPNCGVPALLHTVCPTCGTYKGKQVIVIATPEGDESDSE